MRRKLYYIFYSIVLISGLSSCISSEETNYLQEIKLPYPLQQYEEYKLVAGDAISCNITSHDKNFAAKFNKVIGNTEGSSNTYLINEDGTIILPFFGAVKVTGLTIQQSEQAIQKFIQESITDAQVKVSLASNFFYILSKDKKGKYDIYKDNLTIYQALAISEQTTESMDLSKVSIVRLDKEGNTITKTFDLRSYDVIQSEYYYIKPNDVIYFPTNKNAFFGVTSLNSFLEKLLAPLTLLFFASTYTK